MVKKIIGLIGGLITFVVAGKIITVSVVLCLGLMFENSSAETMQAIISIGEITGGLAGAWLAVKVWKWSAGIKPVQSKQNSINEDRNNQ